MDKNLVPMIKHAKANDMIMIIVTNGVIFGDDETCKKVHNMSGQESLETIYDNDGSLILKLESLEKEKYDRIVGVKGSHEKYMTGINRIEKLGFGKDEDGVTRLAFSSVIMKNNIEELQGLKDFADRLNAQYICKLPSLVRNALDNIDNMFEVNEYEDIR